MAEHGQQHLGNHAAVTDHQRDGHAALPPLPIGPVRLQQNLHALPDPPPEFSAGFASGQRHLSCLVVGPPVENFQFPAPGLRQFVIISGLESAEPVLSEFRNPPVGTGSVGQFQGFLRTDQSRSEHLGVLRHRRIDPRLPAFLQLLPALLRQRNVDSAIKPASLIPLRQAVTE